MNSPQSPDALSHDEAIDALIGCAKTVTVLSYQEAIEGYFKLRNMDWSASTPALPDDVAGLVERFRKLKETADRCIEESDGLADHKLIILANYGDLALQNVPNVVKALEAQQARIDECEKLLAKCAEQMPETVLDEDNPMGADEDGTQFYGGKPNPLVAEVKSLLTRLEQRGDG